MNKLNLICFIGLYVLCVQLHADDYLDMYALEEEQSTLDAKDEAVLSRLSALEQKTLSGNAFNPGQVQFTFGAGVPTIVCALLELSDILLEKGERIFNVHLGDTARWSIDTMVSGNGENRTEHIIVKPLDSGLKTTLVIATDRRTYHIRLKSSVHDFMPQISFVYPNEGLFMRNGGFRHTPSEDKGFDYSIARAAPYDKATTKVSYETSYRRGETKSAPQSGSRNYAYDIYGDDRLIPVNAYDDGVNTYIQMDPSLKHQDLPALMRVNVKEGLFFDDEALSAVNFKLEGNTFVVFGLYEHLRLVDDSTGSTISADIRRLS